MEIVQQSHRILTPINRLDVYRFLELAGRTAYKSEDKITEGSADSFLRNLIHRGHESVLEHFSVTVRFITDRGVTHEEVRHRLCAFTQESTRYCNYGKKGLTYIMPVWMSEKDSYFWEMQEDLQTISAIYLRWLKRWAKPDGSEDPQKARYFLPNGLKTEIVHTADIREWRHILKLRTAVTAHPQIRALMIPFLFELNELLPALFFDIIAYTGEPL